MNKTFSTLHKIKLLGLNLLIVLLYLACSSDSSKPEKENSETLQEVNTDSIESKLPEKIPTHLLPSGYRLVTEASGDLNKDSQADKVLVLFHKSEPTQNSPIVSQDAEEPRLLMVFLAQGGKYKLAIKSKRAIMCRQCGGVMGDPYQGVKIERNSFIISHFGGSRLRWGFDHRFQLRNGKWRMTGLTETEYDSALGTSQVTDTNLLNGDQIITTTDSYGKKSSQKARITPTERYLSNFSVE